MAKTRWKQVDSECGSSVTGFIFVGVGFGRLLPLWVLNYLWLHDFEFAVEGGLSLKLAESTGSKPLQ